MSEENVRWVPLYRDTHYEVEKGTTVFEVVPVYGHEKIAAFMKVGETVSLTEEANQLEKEIEEANRQMQSEPDPVEMLNTWIERVETRIGEKPKEVFVTKRFWDFLENWCIEDGNDISNFNIGGEKNTTVIHYNDILLRIDNEDGLDL